MTNDARNLNSYFARTAPDTFARMLGTRDFEEIVSVLDGLPVDLQVVIACRLPARHIHALMGTARFDVSKWLSSGDVEDAVSLLSRIGREKRMTLVNSVSNEERRRRLLRSQQYPGHSIGALVQDINVHILADASATDVAAELRALGDTDPGALVVTDRSGRYVGMLDAWRLLAAEQPEGTARKYLEPISGVHPEMPISAIATSPDWHATNWLPVLDNDMRVLGAVSRTRVLEAAGPKNEPESRDILFDLLDELVHVAGTVTERLLKEPDNRQ